ncbi:MAG: AAA family ATPase [Clostridia bacterium]|nr:AAA family ATPase [Clostridia bacterium]
MRGIAIMGLNGGGKSTLAHALAKEIGYFELDVEDCYFPEQRESRKFVLENDHAIETEHLGLLPFSNPRSKSEVEEIIINIIKTNPNFILSGVTMNWDEKILSKIDLAFWIQTPVEVRLQRIQAREEKRFGSRVLHGGDMFLQQEAFKEVVKNRDIKSVEESVSKFGCPVIVIDGMYSVENNLKIVKENISCIAHEK